MSETIPTRIVPMLWFDNEAGAISLVINCEDQAAVGRYWEKLTAYAG